MAHIRLLMRKDAKDLNHGWRWGTDAHADLLLVDPSNFAGQMARSRAEVTGMRVVLICDPGDVSEGALAIIRPFKAGNIVETLNHAMGDSAALGSSIPGDDYFQSQMRDYESDADIGHLLSVDGVAQRRPVDGDVALGLDELFQDNPLADRALQRDGQTFDKNADVDGSGDQTRRSALRSDLQREANATPLNAAPIPRTPERKPMVEDNSAHRLREYLEGKLLAGPVQIAWPDAGVLTLDPKNQVFHSAQGLRNLEVYCKESVRRRDWRVLTTTELFSIRESQEAQPYVKLIWLDVLLHANGQLASNLDPGGTFELSRWLEIARDYPQYARISAALMKPARLHEVTAAAGCEMSMVFDVVSAYDAIGWLKWTARPSRHADENTSKKSFLDRLRMPFSKP